MFSRGLPDMPGENADDEALPSSPARRRLATLIALIFIAVIVAFLVWFIATNRERLDGGRMVGQAPTPGIPAIHQPSPRSSQGPLAGWFGSGLR